MNKDTLHIAAWVLNLSYPVSSAEAWVGLVRDKALEAKQQGADILMLPEYISEQWIHFAPENLHLTAEVPWMAAISPQVTPHLQKIAQETGLMIVAGSMPWPNPTGEGEVNRCWVFFPDREPFYHDKLVLIPSERDPASWNLSTGNHLRVTEWRGIRMAVVICLDVEMPALSHALASQSIDLLLVPSMTFKPSGYHRVFGCAKARAIELMCAVAVTGVIGGGTKYGKPREQHHGGAAVYLPCEEEFGFNGLHSEIAMHNHDAGPGQVLYARDIPLAAIHKLRTSNPEVWPGPWDAHHVKIERV